jgi:nitroreductase
MPFSTEPDESHALHSESTGSGVPAPLRIARAVADPSSVEDAIRSRLSVRAFLDRPVPRATVEDLLDLAATAPSGSNAQPWKAYVLQGASRDALVARAVAAHDAMRADPAAAARYSPAYDYYPTEWIPPYRDRRRVNGWGLYALLGIGRGDKDAMHAQHQRNYRFFGAPVGLMFTVDKAMGRGSLLDYGLFLQTLMIAARARGLHTCAQGAWLNLHEIVLDHVGAGPDEMLVCGMALGHADPAAPINAFDTPREPAKDFTRWLD